MISTVEHVQTSRITGVGVEQFAVVVFVKNTNTRRLIGWETTRLKIVKHFALFHFIGCERGLIIIIEVTVER